MDWLFESIPDLESRKLNAINPRRITIPPRVSINVKLSCNNIKLVDAAKTGSREKIIAVVIVLTN